MIEVIEAGFQTTVQAGVRRGLRHFGVPGAGAADQLSMSLANRLVGAPTDQPALEMTLTGGRFRFHFPGCVAVTGAESIVRLNGAEVPMHQTIKVSPGDEIEVGASKKGCRSYLALTGKLCVGDFLGSKSTYLPGGFGGFHGRALKNGDRIELAEVYACEEVSTPPELRPYFNDNFLIQVSPSSDYEGLNTEARASLFELGLKATQRASRMGVELAAEHSVLVEGIGNKQSAPVFPGTVQCPPEGRPFILLSDAQTTGGYPHILQVVRSDRFMLGQIRPGAQVRFLLRTPEEAVDRFRTRWTAYSDWLTSSEI